MSGCTSCGGPLEFGTGLCRARCLATAGAVPAGIVDETTEPIDMDLGEEDLRAEAVAAWEETATPPKRTSPGPASDKGLSIDAERSRCLGLSAVALSRMGKTMCAVCKDATAEISGRLLLAINDGDEPAEEN